MSSGVSDDGNPQTTKILWFCRATNLFAVYYIYIGLNDVISWY